jgi:KRAB domain-containing zinc finger protein
VQNVPLSHACSQCAYRCKTTSQLQAHKEKHKVDRPRPFLCSVCGATLVSAISLKRHLETHNQGRPFQCPHADCPYASKTDRLLADHVHRVHLAQLKPCDVCGKMLKARSMRQHKQSMHSDGKEDGKVQCNLCSRFFSNKTTLASHMRLHANARIFECDFCNKRYYFLKYLHSISSLWFESIENYKLKFNNINCAIAAPLF